MNPQNFACLIICFLGISTIVVATNTINPDIQTVKANFHAIENKLGELLYFLMRTFLTTMACTFLEISIVPTDL